MQKAQALTVRAFIDEHPVNRHQMLITERILLVVAFDGMDILLFRGLDGPRAQLTTRLRLRPPHHAMTAIARGTAPLEPLYAARLQLLEAADAAGVFGARLAEPHGMASSVWPP